MAKLPDDTAFGAIEAGLSGRSIASFDTTGYSRGAAAMAQGVKDIGAGLEKAGKEVYAVALQQEKQKALAAFNEAKANADYLTRTQELRGRLNEETDPSNLPAFEQHFEAANADRVRAINDPVKARQVILEGHENTAALVTEADSRLKSRQRLGETNVMLQRNMTSALQAQSPDILAQFVDSSANLIHALRGNNDIDPAAAQKMQEGWVVEYATKQFLAQPAKDQVAEIRARLARTGGSQDGAATGGATAISATDMPGDPSGTPHTAMPTRVPTAVDYLPQERLPDLLQTAELAVARNAESETTTRFASILGFLDEANRGRKALPDRAVIEQEPNLSPALKNVLLQKYDTAVESGRVFKTAQNNASNPDYVWNPRSEADRKGLSILDNWTEQVSGIASADPQMRSVAVKRFAAIGMVSDDVKGTLEGMVRSGNEQKIEFAMSTLDGMQRVNPNGFRASFDQETSKTLIAWQERVYQPPGSFQAWLKRSSDPVMAKAREGAQARARQLADNMSDDDIVAVHDESWFSDPGKPMGTRDAPGMDVYRQHWTALFAEGYASFDGDVKLAKKFANDWIKQTWSVSDANGGRLTMFAPEKAAAELAFPSVNGSYGWMKQQVLETLRAQVGPVRVENVGRTTPAKLRERRIAENNFPPKYWLVPEENTRSEIETLKAGYKLPNERKSPAWTLVYIDPKANYPKQVQFYFDVNAATAERAKGRQDNLTGDLRLADREKANAQRIEQQRKNWRMRAQGWETSPTQSVGDAP